jgi:hypothetical protein
MSVAMSLFLFRKVLPSSPPSISEFLDRISQPSPGPDPDFLNFAGDLVDKIFEEGWDGGYSDVVLNSSVGTSSCEEGGCTRERYLQEYGGDSARGTFVRVCLGQDPSFEFLPVKARMKSVFTAGKHRIVSIPQVDHHHLRPLHNLFYNHLSRQGWLLRGDAVPRRFEGKTAPFSRVDGEVFVSGDYEGATDNLNNHVQRFLLERVLSRCRFVPESIRRYAIESMSPMLSFEGKEVRLRTGQMMGFLLSFPLLCLVNYVTFRYYVRRKVPVKINGDDIVFRATREEFELWASGVGASGLRLSVGKTMVSQSYFSLNSTLFRASRTNGVKLVPFIRSKALFGVEEGKSSPFFSLRGRLGSFCVGFSGPARNVWLETFLKCNRGYIKRAKCSISRGLGVPLPKSVLQAANLWDRECAYLELPKEKPPPLPFSVWSHPPEGYQLAYSEEKYKYSKEEKDRLSRAFCDAAWKAPKDVGDFEPSVVGLSIPQMNAKKFSRLAGITFSEVRSILSTRRDEVYSRYLSTRVRRYQYWKECDPPRQDDVGPLCEAPQEIGETINPVFYPPPVVLYGMCPPEGYEVGSRDRMRDRRRLDVVPFRESIVCRDPSGFVVSRHDHDDVELMWG